MTVREISIEEAKEIISKRASSELYDFCRRVSEYVEANIHVTVRIKTSAKREYIILSIFDKAKYYHTAVREYTLY